MNSKTKIIMKAIISISLLASLLLCSCGGNTQTSGNPSSTSSVQAESANSISIDELYANADSLTDKLVTIEAVCTHTCRHGARKIFLQGSDNSQLIRCEYADQRPFSKECVHSVVRVSGYLRETRMNEAYLNNWKMEYELAKAQSQDVEGEEYSSSAGCATESAARRESGNSVDEKIENYRRLIAQRKETEGKDYLSFYHLEATDYVIVSE